MKKSLMIGMVAAALLMPGAAHAKRVSLLMTFGQDITIAGKDDDVSIHAQCVANEGGMGNDVVRLYAKTANDAVLKGSYSAYSGNGTYLTAVTPAASAVVASLSQTVGQEYFSGPIDSGFVLNLTTSHGLVWTNESTVLGLNFGANDCVLSINIDSVKKFKVVEP